MSFQLPDLFARDDIPQADARLGKASGGRQRFAVGRKRYRGDVLLRRHSGPEFPAIAQIKDANPSSR